MHFRNGAGNIMEKICFCGLQDYSRAVIHDKFLILNGGDVMLYHSLNH